MRRTLMLLVLLFPIWAAPNIAADELPAGDAALGSKTYDDYEPPQNCVDCHVDFYRQWEQMMMSQSYTHAWDEIEYFKLAVPHAEQDEMVAGVKAGCNGCHAPLAFFAGDIPPPAPADSSRANEGVSCDVCHTAVGFAGDVPYNFNFISQPGDTKYGPRAPSDEAPHGTARSDFLGTTQFCGTCHNEKSPYGVWVKSTQLEWQEGPYASEGVLCQDCHMSYAAGISVEGGPEYPDVRQHLFHGAHDPGKVRGTVEVRIHPDAREVRAGRTVKFTVALFNQKAGHKFPTGSVEDRIVWLHVEATDEEGNRFHLPVDTRGFEGEEYTIATDALAYQDMGMALHQPDFAGVPRDGVPAGDRIFRMPYFDPQGRMTIQQWNTHSLGTDYRLGPRETKLETYTFTMPADVTPGLMRVTATLYYSRLVKPVAELLGVPADETEPIVVGSHTTEVVVLPI